MSRPSNSAPASAPVAATAGKPAEADPAPIAGSPAVAAKATQAGSPAVAKTAKAGLGRRLQVRVGAESARADLFSGWRKPRVIATHQVEYRPGIATLPEAVEAVDALLTALAAAAGPIKGLRCDVLIGDAWMLYDVVRADLRSLSPRAADDLVRSALADVAGLPPSDLVIRWQTQTGGQCTLACGVPAAVLPSLQTLLRAHRLRAGEIVGEFVHEYNANRGRLLSPCAVISLVRETGAQLAVSTNGVLTAMSFELGVRAPEELESRGRSLLRGAGIASDGETRFFALLPKGWTPPSPWVGLQMSA